MSTRNQIESKIKKITKRIEQIENLGGIPGFALNEDLIKLKEALKEYDQVSPLEIQFSKELKKVQDEVDIYINEVKALIDKILQRSKETGIPVRGNIHLVYDQYVPESFFDKWCKEIDENTGIYKDSHIFEKYDIFTWKSAGWQQSDLNC